MHCNYIMLYMYSLQLIMRLGGVYEIERNHFHSGSFYCVFHKFMAASCRKHGVFLHICTYCFLIKN